MKRFRWLTRSVAVGALCVALGACANPNVTRENYQKIHEGMPMEQVEQILGSPSRKHKDKCYYNGKYGRIEIEVEKGCVDDVEWED